MHLNILNWLTKLNCFSCIYGLGLSLFCLMYSASSLAGPPYRTDDPEPTPYTHYEVFIASQYQRTSDGTTGTIPHVEINYGFSQNIQIGIKLPYAFSQVNGNERHYGLGDIELGVKYRLVDESDTTPMISFFPSYKSHSGNIKENLGDGANGYYLPIWVGKSWGDWTTYGGGGYKINQADDAVNSWSFGWLVQRQVTEKLSLGGELFYETEQTHGEGANTGVNVGAIYDINENNHIIFSCGKGIQHANQTNKFSSFLAYSLTF